MADDLSGQSLGAIYAQIKVDTSTLERDMAGARRAMELADDAAEQFRQQAENVSRSLSDLAASALESSNEVRRAVSREVEHNLKEKVREAEERAALVQKTLATELEADQQRRRSFNEALAADIQARARAADAAAELVARQNADEIASDRATQRAKNEALAADIQARARAADERAALVARQMRDELESERALQRARNEMLAADIQARAAAADARTAWARGVAPGRIGLSDAQATQQTIAAQRQYNQLMGQGAFAARSYSTAMLQVGWAVDDAQYGMAGLGNNIIGLTTAFFGFRPAVLGVAAGLTGAAAIYRNWNALVSAGRAALYAGIPTTKSAGDEIKELGKKQHKTNEETARYIELKERQKRAEATSSIRSEEEETQEGAVNKAIKAAGGGKKVKGQLAGVLAASPLTADEELDKKADEAEALYRKMVDLEKRRMTDAESVAMHRKFAEEARKKAQDARNEKAGKLANDIVSESTVDPDQLKAFQGYVKANPNSFAPDLGENLQKGTPEAVKKAVEAKRTKELRDEGKSHADILNDINEAEEKKRTQEAMTSTDHGTQLVPGFGSVAKAFDDTKTDLKLEAKQEKKDGAAHKAAIGDVVSNFRGPMGKKIQAAARRMSADDIRAAVETELRAAGVSEELIADAAHEIVRSGVNKALGRQGAKNLGRGTPGAGMPAGRARAVKAAAKRPWGVSAKQWRAMNGGGDAAAAHDDDAGPVELPVAPAPLPTLPAPRLDIAPGSLGQAAARAMPPLGAGAAVASNEAVKVLMEHTGLLKQIGTSTSSVATRGVSVMV